MRKYGFFILAIVAALFLSCASDFSYNDCLTKCNKDFDSCGKGWLISQQTPSGQKLDAGPTFLFCMARRDSCRSSCGGAINRE